MKVIGNVPYDFGEDVDYFDGTIIVLTEYEYEQLEELINSCEDTATAFKYIRDISAVRHTFERFKKAVDDLESQLKEEG